ncbi:serine/threonine protein kinase [Alloscardovia theropitheci]|uniref:non-specific serine/threonine protein kinase n=1 Tax=Alloscardovia theropitheci TaxID=2496842 RepID=A0A4R0QSW4_9BIFI|nr:serine/threonine protein kinase [Alloscardovia theropitheci]
MAENYSALDLAPGHIVGGYTLLNRLDQGGMGTIWRVRDDGGTIYAMKILLDSLSDDDTSNSTGDSEEQLTARERFRREALALRKIDHPGVNRIVDMELDDALAFIVTELIEGKNLRDDVYENGRYTAEDLENLSRMLIDAVDAVHAAGIIHRDIKPTNVMISQSGPILVDFGIAMGENESHVTRTGLVMGTPGFIAPEIIDGAESDEATDWWSVASVIGFAATGKPIFGSKPLMTVLEREASGNADLSGLPPVTLQAMRAALNPDRMQRCSAQELLSAIHEDAQYPDLWDNGELSSVAATTVMTTDSPVTKNRYAYEESSDPDTDNIDNVDPAGNRNTGDDGKTSVMPPFLQKLFGKSRK